MATDIKRLLNKKGWTGEEVGKALIASMLNDIKNQGKPYQPLFTQADFEKMESSLSTERDYLAYGVYRDIYSSVIDSFNRGQGLYQQFYNGYSRLLTEFREIQHTEDAQKIIARYPLIVTEEQYKRLEAEASARLKAHTESFNSLLFCILDTMLEAEPTEIPKAIADALEATKTEPAANQHYIDLYNSTFGEGYYSLPDGRRSDKMTGEEWRAALKELYLSTHKLTINGEPASAEETVKEYNTTRLLRSYELFFKGADAIREAYREATGRELEGENSEILEALEDIIDGAGRTRYNPLAQELERAFNYDTPTEWHEATEPPADLTQNDLLDIYVEQSRTAQPTPADEKRPLKDLKKDYPALYEALTAYIEEHIPQARELKANQLYKEFISWGELAELGVFKYQSFITPADTDIVELFTEENTTANYSKRERILFNSIAIVKNPHRDQIDENGDYIEHTNPLAPFANLDSVAEDVDSIAEIAAYQRNLINPALSYLYAFNALMGILGAVYDLPELEEVARFDTAIFESKIDAFNSLLYMFYSTIYAKGEELEKKREQIKAIFTPLDADKLKPSQEAIDAVTADIEKLGYSTTARKKLKYLDSFIDQLRGEGAI